MARRDNRRSEERESLSAPSAVNWFDVPPTPPAGILPDAGSEVADTVSSLGDILCSTPQTTMSQQPGSSGAHAVDGQPEGAQLGELFGDVESDAGSAGTTATDESGFSGRPATAAPTSTGLTIAAGKQGSNRWTGYRDLDGIWPIVEQFRNFVSTDAVLQSKAKDLVLTRDAEVNEQQKREILALLTKSLAARGGTAYQPEQMGPALDLLYDEIVGISVLGELWRDDNVTEIMVDRWDRVVVESNGRLMVTDVRFRDPEHANDVARSLALRVSDRSVSQKLPLVTAELPQARVTFCYGPVVRGGLSITIRKFRPLLTLDTLLANNSVNQELVELLRDLVHARATILVSGGTGTGKTTIINLLSSFIPDSERVITIEDAFELQLTNTHVVSLQTKEASSSDDQVSVTLSDLLRNTLRMRPDRIIVGEVREGEGALTMLAAANTGHDGTMTTIHANSPSMAVNERLTDLIRQTRATPDDVAKRTIASAFDVVVQVSRSAKGQRFISEVAAIEPSSIVAGQAIPETIFVGEETPDGKIAFRRSGRIRVDSRLGRKLAMALVNPGRWS
jgi:pilus assembly protein CpaF